MAEHGRLIDADQIRYEPMLSARGNGNYVEVMVAYKDQIDDLPAIEPERKKGEWIDKEGGIATCSVCGNRWGVWSTMKYCPDCGADMRQKE